MSKPFTLITVITTCNYLSDLPLHLRCATYTYCAFLQITDIHFSVVDNLSISYSLELFCHDVIKTIIPSLVIVSGDLTHAKFADERSSQQFPSEWKAYHNVLQKCNLEGIPWLDIRGNHGTLFWVLFFVSHSIVILPDDFNVPSYLDRSNYFL